MVSESPGGQVPDRSGTAAGAPATVGGPRTSAGPSPLVLDEDAALELLAYLVTAARTQVDEAAEYGPLRLLTAARRLGAAIAPRSSPQTAAFVTGPLAAVPELAVPRDGRAEYVARIDELCRALGLHLTERFASRPGVTR